MGICQRFFALLKVGIILKATYQSESSVITLPFSAMSFGKHLWHRPFQKFLPGTLLI